MLSIFWTPTKVVNPSSAKLIRHAFKARHGRRCTYHEAIKWYRSLDVKLTVPELNSVILHESAQILVAEVKHTKRIMTGLFRTTVLVIILVLIFLIWLFFYTTSASACGQIPEPEPIDFPPLII